MGDEISRDLEAAAPEEMTLGGQLAMEKLRAEMFGALPQAILIGRFRVLHKLGAGGMGSVYAAYDQKLDRRVALKLLHRHIEARPGLQQRLLEEAQSMARLNHPNVVQVYDVGEYEGRSFVAMEFVAGQTIREWLGASPRGWRAVVSVYRQAGAGLAAAHERGVIHRDFKPDNVIVEAETGRVCVLDFGLAMTAGAADGDRSGTPAYMAPEQQRGEASDARSDLYSFCVAVYEGICGERPLDGAGVRRPPPPPAVMPAWLLAVLERGVEADAGARWPSMTALLQALDHDPAHQRQARGRRRLGWALAVAGCLGLAGGLSLAREQWGAWSRAREASDKLDEVLSSTDLLLAQGRTEDAQALLGAFLLEARYQQTPSVSQGWLAAHERGLGGPPIDACVAAYRSATRAKEREAALLALGLLLQARRDWAGLQGLLEAVPGDAPAFAPLRLQAAMGARDFEAARSLLGTGSVEDADAEALLGALSAAAETELSSVRAIWSLPATPLLVANRPRDGASAFTFHEADLSLREAPISPLRGTLLRLPGAGASASMVLSGGGESALYALEGDQLVETVRWPDSVVQAYTVADLDGDGTDEHYAATGYRSRHLLQLWPDEGRVEERVPVDETLSSDIMGLHHADLDQDGRDELILSLGAWSGYEVRLFQHDADTGALSFAGRKKLGSLSGAGVLSRAGAPPLVVVTKENFKPNALIFGDEAPYGEAPGIYLLRYDGASLLTDRFLPAPWPDGGGEDVEFGHLRLGDVDGDGLEDIVVGVRERPRGGAMLTRSAVVVYRQQRDGGFSPTTLGRLWLRGMAQLDADPAQELLVSLEESPERVWVLGAGAARLPPPARPAPLGGAPPAGAPSQWSQAAALGDMGLYTASADAFSQLAAEGTPSVRAAAAFRAAVLYERAEQDTRANTLYLQAAASPAFATDALWGAFRASLRQGRFGEAAQRATALLRRSPTDADRALLERYLKQPPAVHRVDFDAPLSGAWVLPNPIGTRRDPLTESLRIDAVDGGVLAELPIQWSGEALSVTLDMDVRHGEYGGKLRFLLLDAEGEALMKLRASVAGGGRQLRLSLRCHIAGQSEAFHERAYGTDFTGPLTVQMRLLPSIGERSCVIARGEPEPVWFWRSPLLGDGPLAPGDYTFRIELAEGRRAAVGIDLQRIELGGVQVPAEALARAPGRAHALVEGRFAEVLADQGAPPLWRAEAAFRLGRLPEARAEMLRALEADAPGVRTFLRASPTVAGALIRAARGDEIYRWYRDVWAWARWGNLDMPSTQRALLATLRDLDRFSPRTADDRAVKAELLRWRAEIALRQAHPAVARRDLVDALALLGDEQGALRAEILAELAGVYAQAGETDAALGAIDDALRASASPLQLAEHLRARPALQGLTSTPRWRALVPD